MRTTDGNMTTYGENGQGAARGVENCMYITNGDWCECWGCSWPAVISGLPILKQVHQPQTQRTTMKVSMLSTTTA